MGIEVQQRSVIAFCVRTQGQFTDAQAQRVQQLLQAQGADVLRGADVMHAVFGLVDELHESAPEALRTALELVYDGEGRLQIGLFEAEALCNGEVGTAGFAYELAGDGAERADALAQQAPPGAVLVSGHVARYTPYELLITPVQLPGKSSKELAFWVRDVRREPARRRPPFVGREAEKEQLLGLVGVAHEGRVMVLDGPLGIGKSRLVREVVPLALEHDVSFCVVPASLRPELGPSHPLGRVALLGWNVQQGADSGAAKYVLDTVLTRTHETDQSTGDRKQQRVVAAAIDGVARRSAVGPLVVVMDDLQSADDVTWALCQRLVEVCPVLGFSVVLCVRSEVDIPFPMGDDILHLTLAPLPTDTIGAIAASSAPIDGTQAGVTARIARGNPLVAQQVACTLRLGPQTRDVVQSIDGHDVLTGLQQLVEARVAALSPATRKVLKTAAVLGTEFYVAEAMQIGGGDASPKAMEELLAAGLVVPRMMGRAAFTFAELRDRVLASMPEPERQSLHSRAGAMLAKAGGMTGPRLGELAEHMFRGGDFFGAVEALRRAAEGAMLDGAMRRASILLKLVLKACDEVGDVLGEPRARVARELSKVLLQMGDTDEAELVLRSASPMARAQGYDLLAADLLRLHGAALVKKGDAADGIKEVEAALYFAERKGFHVVAAEASQDLADLAETSGDADAARAWIERGLVHVTDKEDKDSLALRLGFLQRLARQQLQAKDFASAIDYFSQALSLTEAAHDRHAAAGILGNLGGAFARTKDMRNAMEFTESALRASEEVGDPMGVARQSYNLALLRLSSGEREGAKEMMLASQEAARRAGWRDGITKSQAALEKLGA